MARYRDAIQWIADETTAAALEEDDPYLDVVSLTAWLFGRERCVVVGDALHRRDLDLARHQRMIDAEEDEEARSMDA